jgi:predicted nucleic-acid-binding Zn-ribbon protein
MVPEKQISDKPQIEEIKVTCWQCHHIWFYDESDRTGFGTKPGIKTSLVKTWCCCSCFPLGFVAFLIPKKKFNHCPKCGSRAIQKEIVTHNL